MAKQRTLDDAPAILVSGGSGYIGSALVRHLAKQGMTVVSMYRHRLPESLGRVYPFCSNMESSELLATPLRGVETVVHLAWEDSLIGPAEGSSPQDISLSKSYNLRILKNLLEAMEKAKTPRLIFFSAVGANYNSNLNFLREKYLAESLVLNSEIPQKIILRPTFIYGGEVQRDKFLQTIKKLMRFPGIYPLPAWKKPLYPLRLQDVVEFTCGLINQPLVLGVTIEALFGQQGFRIEDLFKLIQSQERGGTCLVLGSFLGQQLLPLFEKDLSSNGNNLKVKHFLSLSDKPDSNLLGIEHTKALPCN